MTEVQKAKKVEPGFPKWKYHKTGKSKLIESKAAEDLLGLEWKASPADHGQPAHPYSDEQLALMEQAKVEEEKPRAKKNGITLE